MEHNRELARCWDGGCSCVSWSTEDGKHLWGRNYDFDRIARGTAVTWLPAGTAYFPGGQEAGPRLGQPPLSSRPRRPRASPMVDQAP